MNSGNGDKGGGGDQVPFVQTHAAGGLQRVVIPCQLCFRGAYIHVCNEEIGDFCKWWYEKKALPISRTDQVRTAAVMALSLLEAEPER